MSKVIFLIVASLYGTVVLAEEPLVIYKCGNEYTNSVPKGQEKNCKQISPKQLSKGENEQLQECQLEATKNPTEFGVKAALAICKEKFEK
jgi:hypothetical protein